MMTDDEVNKARAVVGVVLGVFLIYLVAAAGGAVPDDYNVFKLFEEEPEPILAQGTGYVLGFPTAVNVTAQENNSYIITFGCNESYVGGMELVLEPDDDLVNTTVYWTGTSTDWVISDDGYTATYVGEPLTNGLEIGSLVLHVDGGAVEDNINVTISTDIGELDITEAEFTIEIYEEP